MSAWPTTVVWLYVTVCCARTSSSLVSGLQSVIAGEQRAFDTLKTECEALKQSLVQSTSSAKAHLIEMADSKELAQSHLKAMAQTQQLLVVQAQAQLQTFSQLSQV